MTTPQADNLEAAVERLEVVAWRCRYKPHGRTAPWTAHIEPPLRTIRAADQTYYEPDPLVRLADAQAALSSSNARAVAAEEALRAFRHADPMDWDYLLKVLFAAQRSSQDAQTKFWITVLNEFRTTLASMKGADHD